MKTYFDSNVIAHQWVHRLAPRGSCPQSKSFEGDKFYSYGTEIARLCEHKGKQYVLMNNSGYSVTTSKHQIDVRGSIPESVPIFTVSNCGRGISLDGFTGDKLLDYQLDRAAQSQAKADKANRVNKDKHLATVAGILESAKGIANFFGLKRKIDTKAIARFAARINAEKARQEQAAKTRQAKLEKDNSETVAKWLAGEQVQFPYSVQRVYLRFFPEFDLRPARVETSRGVTIPATDAERAFRFAVARKSKGWHRNGEQFAVGQYQLDAINTDGIVAGCHRIAWPEIERFAKLQGWMA